ncbi:hypothetical protein [Catenulispora rubra]|uniref:hypothetical protein n=1 Tax=Catenulispora rubra TaxID=280293 RepID=UPI00189287FC|nr:hypothetical protein [Catenulispora rubra]
MAGRTRRFARAAAAVSALAVAMGSAAACSSSGSSGGGGGGGGSGAFADALKNVHDTAQTSGSIEFGDTAQLAKLNGGTTPASNGPFGRLVGTGSDQLTQYASVLPPLTGFDSTTATSAISLGLPPDQVGVLYGSFDPTAIGTKLAAWGYHKSDRGGGVTAWVFQDNHQMDLTKLDANGIGPGMTGWLNVIWVSKSSIAYGSATSDLAAALPAQSKPLSGDAMVGSLADCLGSTLIAYVNTDAKQINNSGISAIAFGVTATGTSDIREEICAAAPSASAAQGFATGFTKAVGSGLDYVRNQPWSALLTDPQTKVIGGSKNVVRLTAKPVAPQGAALVVNLVVQNDFAGLLGLPQVISKVGVPGGSVTLTPTQAPSS